jgi:SnoaL-like domain
MRDQDVQDALQRHWVASDAEDFAGEHEIYEDHAVLEYPQSGERIHGRQRIQEWRTAQSDKRRFTIRRLLGSGALWVSEITVTYDERTVWLVSIMEFEGKKVVRETQYFGSPFDPDPSCARWVERMN